MASNRCPYCDSPYPSDVAVSNHIRNGFCPFLNGPKEPCNGCDEHMGGHVHAMRDGTWAYFFDDMKLRGGFKNYDDALVGGQKVMRGDK